MKKYWLKGLILGLLFGVLITYLHENFEPFQNFHSFGFFIEKLYGFSFTPFLFYPTEYGTLIPKIQYYLPPIVYGIFGLLVGIISEGIKNRKIIPVSVYVKKIVIILVIIGCLIIAGKFYLKDTIYAPPYTPQPTFGKQYLFIE
ncbi:MAG: hypothetical protein WCG97_03695 [bacterium]